MQENAIILANGMLGSDYAKTSHGLIRGTERYNILGVIDPDFKGQDAGSVTDNIFRNIPIYASVKEAIDLVSAPVQTAIVGVATKGGVIPPDLMEAIKSSIIEKLNIVSGLHQYLSDKDELNQLASQYDVNLLDIRKPKPVKALHFWSGEIFKVKSPIIAVIGTDCALGKRTTARFLRDETRKAGLKSEMIFTGQTGWLQGGKYGFILDSTVNDFVSGELENAIVDCYENEKPDLIFIEGQAAMLNPSGPCGSELIVSGNAKAVILQHALSRRFYKGWESIGIEIPDIQKNIKLIEAYDAKVIGICLNTAGSSSDDIENFKNKLAQQLNIPVIQPVEDGVTGLIPAITNYMNLYKEKHEN